MNLMLLILILTFYELNQPQNPFQKRIVDVAVLESYADAKSMISSYKADIDFYLVHLKIKIKKGIKHLNFIILDLDETR